MLFLTILLPATLILELTLVASVRACRDGGGEPDSTTTASSSSLESSASGQQDHLHYQQQQVYHHGVPHHHRHHYSFHQHRNHPAALPTIAEERRSSWVELPLQNTVSL